MALALSGLPGLADDSATATRPTIVVAKTEASTSVASWQPDMGKGLADIFISELNKLDNLKVLESVALDDLREERKLGETGEVSSSESVKKGGWKGADYTFRSVVTRFGAKESTYGGGGGGLPLPGPRRGFGIPLLGGGVSVKTSEHEVQIDWRIIDNTTREIVTGASGTAVGVEKGTGFNFATFGGGGFANNREFMDSALGKATMKAVADVVAKVKVLQLTPGTRATQAAATASAERMALRNVRGSVELVDGKEIWVSLGAKNGFAVGDKVKIYQPVEKKNSQGKVVLTTYKEMAEIVLKKVKQDTSMGEYSGSAKIGEGWAAADADVDIEKLE